MIMADDTRIESLPMEDSTYEISEDEIENEEHIDELLETDDDGNLNWHGIRQSITPQTLARCRTSSLEKALQVSHKLSVLAPLFSGKEGLDELANSVEDFAFKLLEPLKKKIDGIIASKEGNLEDDFDRVCDAAIDYEQKKFLSHYVIYKLLMNHWKGDFYKMQNSAWFSRQHFMWIFYNMWNVLDAFIFPLPYLLMHVMNKISYNIGYRNKTQVDYDQYFVTPYFIFVRDFLNYLLLFGLHVAKCLQPSTLQFTALEWAIMVFFLGRILMEINQMFTEESFEKKAIGSCDALFHPIAKGKRHQIDPARVSKSRNLSKYFGNCWNVLNIIILVDYLVFLILRAVTWSEYTSVWRNRLLAIAGYIFGFNTMVLTLRVFGHILEIFPSTGSIQVALFQIIGAAFTVLGQFIVAILAFSLAITKIYVAEGSYSVANSKGTCGNQSGLACWWSHTTHLAWSLLGDADLEPLHSSDQVSDVIAKLMYCIFLIICVVMLMNMMIALLTNTYQQVEDNAFNEWSYRKANTIRTYSTYHPVPIPFNVISLSIIFSRYICCKMKAKRSNKYSSKTNTCEVTRREMFDNLVLELEDQYFSVYGNDFPVSVDGKIDCLLKEVCGSHQLMAQISQRYLYDVQPQRSTLQGEEESDIKWESHGIDIYGPSMSYVDCSDICREETNSKTFHGHGARCLFPLSEHCPGFEVLITKCKEKRIIAIGIVPIDYEAQEFPCSGWDFPGRYEGTVGYHINNGKIFDEDDPVRGRHGDDAMAYRGDTIGCQILYAQRRHDSLPVIFNLNGRIVGKALLKIKENTGPFYPYLGIGWKGISLHFRLCFKKKASDHHQPSQGITEQLSYLIAKQEAVDQKLDFLIRHVEQTTLL